MSATRETLVDRLLRLLTEHPGGLRVRDCVALIGAEDASRCSSDCAAKLRWLELRGYARRKDAAVKRGIVWLITLMIQVGKFGLTAANKRRLMCLSMFWHFLDVVWIGVFTFVYLMGVL